MASLMGFATSVASVGLSARASTVSSGRVVAMPQSTSAPARFSFNVEAAHKKGTGSTKNGRDSNPQYPGVKKYGGEVVSTGNIIVRQKGNKVGGRNGECQVWPIYTLPDGFGAALRCAALGPCFFHLFWVAAGWEGYRTQRCIQRHVMLSVLMRRAFGEKCARCSRSLLVPRTRLSDKFSLWAGRLLGFSFSVFQ